MAFYRDIIWFLFVVLLLTQEARCCKDIDTLLFSGGGVRGAVYGGAVLALEESGLLESATNFAGTSAGSSVATVLAAGMNRSGSYELRYEP